MEKTGVFAKTKDIFIALLLACIVLFMSLVSIKEDTHWGDDFAAYINEGIAIAEGRLDELTKLNITMHLNDLTDEAIAQGRLTYVWGYPLLHSLVYKIVGFDRESFSLLPYMIPNITALCFTAVFMYLLCRRFGSVIPSVTATLLFCLSNEMLNTAVRNMYSDCLFMFLTVLVFYMTELFCDELKKEGKTQKLYIISAFLGILFWYIYETRLSGATVVLCAGVMTAWTVLKNPSSRKKLFPIILPFAAAIILAYIFDNFIFFPATKNVSDYGKTSLFWISDNARDMVVESVKYLEGFVPHSKIITDIHLKKTIYQRLFAMLPYMIVLSVLVLSGIIFRFKKLWAYIAFILFTAVGIIMLPYNQGIRYYYNLIPLVFVIAVAGWDALKEKLGEGNKKRIITTVLSCIMLFACAFGVVNTIRVSNLCREFVPDIDTPYAPENKRMYTYILENVPEEDTIAFRYARVLYLNTQRKSFWADVNNHSYKDAQYALFTEDMGDTFSGDGKEFNFEYSSGTLYLYKEK